jgi:prenylcysteine oxidase / farnesylcysteine lyase
VSPRLHLLTKTTLRQELERQNFNKKIINQLCNFATLNNYGQTVDIDAFVGVVSIIPLTGDIWSVKGGNYRVVEELLKLSGAKIHLNTTVKSIGKDHSTNSSEKNLLVYQENESQVNIVENSFDYILLAFPIYDKNLDSLKLEFDINNDDFNDRSMQQTNTYLIYGSIKLFEDQINMKKRVNIFSVDQSLPYRCIQTQLPVDYSKTTDSNIYKSNEKKLYKIFTECQLDKKDFDKIFKSGYDLIDFIPWLAYPKYKTNSNKKTIPNIHLDSKERSRVFYLNAMEWSASCNKT